MTKKIQGEKVNLSSEPLPKISKNEKAVEGEGKHLNGDCSGVICVNSIIRVAELIEIFTDNGYICEVKKQPKEERTQYAFMAYKSNGFSQKGLI